MNSRSAARRCLPLGLALACTPPEKSLWTYCSEAPQADASPAHPAPTYHEDVKAIVDGKCGRCHEPGGIGPFSLRTYEELAARKDEAWDAIARGHMPPWLAAPCCAEYRDDFGLGAEERATFRAWVEAGAPEGDPSLPARRPAMPVGGIGRVDVRLEMPEPYTPAPRHGTTDDSRCFLLDWPLDRRMFVTGFEPRPGNRAIVHHMVVGVVSGKDARAAAERDAKSPGPGFDCSGGLGDTRVTAIIGGGVAASRLPEGFGVEVPPGAKILVNIHYSTARHHGGGAGSDRTGVDFRLEPTGKKLGGIVVSNAAWLVGDAMEVKEGDPDAVYYYRYRPTLFTAGKRVWLHAATPHMHEFGSRFALGILRADGTKECMLEIPRWRFGWEQTFWLKTPKVLEPEDQVYVECRFDNSPANQPVVDGVRRPPRDIAWGGNDQDMCAGFFGFAEEP